MAIIRLQGEREIESGVYYEVDASSAPIGEGGMGKVYRGKCVDTKTGVTRPVAIKFLFTDLPEQALERARREAEIRLRNDNLIEMLGFIETDEKRGDKIIKHYHVVSELMHGVSLSDILDGKCADANGEEIPFARKLLNDFTKTPEHFAKVVVKNVLSGLMALHDAGYIHRDIDPSNIMITSDEHIKLIDFGICKQMNNLTTNDKALTVAGSFMGKPEYASPELALGDLKHQNQTTDTYAMGILLYQCIMGHVPFEGSRFDVLDKQIKEKVPVKNIKDKEMRRIISKACEKKQEMRYQTSAEMRVDIESLDVKRAADPRKKRLVMMFCGLALIIVVGGLIAFSSYQTKMENEAIAQQEKNYTDSLQSVVNRSVTTADSLTNIGLKHDEGFDKYLVDAKEQYMAASAAVALLSEKNIKSKDFSKKEAVLDEALSQALFELNEKADILETDEDPEVVNEAKAIRARVRAISDALNSKK